MPTDWEPPAVGDMFAQREKKPRGANSRLQSGSEAIWPTEVAVPNGPEPPDTKEKRQLLASGDWTYIVSWGKRIWTKPGLNWCGEDQAHRILTGATPDRSTLRVRAPLANTPQTRGETATRSEAPEPTDESPTFF